MLTKARCRRCGAEYSYSLFGGVYYGMNAHYGFCPECSSVVEEAINKIPVRYESKKVEIFNWPDGFKERVQELHDNPPKKPKSPWETGDFRAFSVVTLPGGYEFSCSVVYQGCRYTVESKSEDDIFGEGTKVFAHLEYDKIDEKVTGKPWIEKDDEEGDYIRHTICNWVDNFATVSEDTAKVFNATLRSFSSSFGPWIPNVQSTDPGQPTSDP